MAYRLQGTVAILDAALGHNSSLLDSHGNRVYWRAVRRGPGEQARAASPRSPNAKVGLDQ
jgi:hypothetical protein